MTRPTRPCTTPRCPELQPCSRHERKPFANATRTTTLYSTARWRRESKAYLAANPWCSARVDVGVGAMRERVRQELERQPYKMIELDGKVACGEPATVVDHRIPHRGDETLFWDQGNWQALCRAHHNAKTGRETRERLFVAMERPVTLTGRFNR